MDAYNIAGRTIVTFVNEEKKKHFCFTTKEIKLIKMENHVLQKNLLILICYPIVNLLTITLKSIDCYFGYRLLLKLLKL